MTKQIVSTLSTKTEIRFLMIPAEDRRLVRKHGLGLQDYWLDCWEADPYGSRYVLMPDTDLKNTTQAKYRKQLEALGLFMFEVRKQGRDRTLWVLNLHGSRVKDFWKPIAESLDQIEQPVDAVKEMLVENAKTRSQIKRTLDQIEQNETETFTQQALQNASTSYQDQYIYQQQINSTVVVGNDFGDKKEEVNQAAGDVSQAMATDGLSASLLNQINAPHQEPTPLSSDQSFAAPSEKIQPTADEIKTVVGRLEALGIKVNHTVVSVIKNYYENTEGAIAHLKERQAQGERFVNPAAVFVKAMKEKAVPTEGIVGQSELDTLKQWFPLAKSLDLISGSMRDNGRLYVFDQDGVPHLFEKMLAEYPLDELRKKTEEQAAERVECPPELRRQLQALFQLP